MVELPISYTELKSNIITPPQLYNTSFKNSFWYYTTIDTADKILAGKSIYISNIRQMNDLDEYELHGKESDRVHCLCFSNRTSESIPMWYLYSGIDGRGAAIKFTPIVFSELIKSIKTLTAPDGTVLKIGTHFDLQCGWAFYRNRSDNKRIRYRNKWYSVDDPDMFKKENYFIKAYPWEYENEFRIVIINKTERAYDKLILGISGFIHKIKIMMAPEISNDDFEKEKPFLNGFANLKQNQIRYSELRIRMNLLRRNMPSIAKNMPVIMEYVTKRAADVFGKLEKRLDSNC